MKRLLFLPLVALPLLVLSCDSQVPTQPAPDEAQPLFGHTLLPMPLAAACSILGTSTPCPKSGGDYYLDGAAGRLWYNVQPAPKGTVVAYRCYDRSATIYPASVCDAGEQRWKAVARIRIPPAADELIFSITHPGVAADGWMLKYQARGSGYESGSVSFTVYNGPKP